jgi:hypothetical protein
MADMADDDIAVRWVFPDDSIDTVIEKVCGASVSTVQLLIPSGVTLLQSDRSYDALRRSLHANQVDLLVISSDEKTLAVARKFDFETIAVHNATIILPETVPSTREQAGVRPIREEKAPPPQTTTRPASVYEELGADDPFAAELDSLSDLMMGEPGAGGDGNRSKEVHPDAPTEPRRRIRPEDIVLSEEEVAQASSIRSGGGRARGARKKARSEKGGGIAALFAGLFKKSPQPSADHAPDHAPDHTAEQPGFPPPRSLTLPLPLSARTFVLLVMLVLVLFGLAMFWLGRVTVQVAPPAPASQSIEFTNQPVLIAQAGAVESDIAVRAEIVSTQHSVTRTGQVLHETLSPGTPAHGTITLLNESIQPFLVPAGTEFIGYNEQGQAVRFTSDEEVQVPPVSSQRQGRQIITTLGAAEVPITARTSGQLSNIEANSITHMAVPGQPQIPLTSGPLFVEHGPIGGGEERPVRIVKQEDVYPVLNAALTDLYNQAVDQLETRASDQGLVLDSETISPDPDDLSRDIGYDVIISPPIGQTVDYHNNTFSVQVRANFSALATPAEAPPLSDQLREVVPNQLISDGVLQPGLAMEPAIENKHWDGSRLTVSGALHPLETISTLDAQTQAVIRNAIKGKTRAEARDELEAFKRQGIISGYILPPMDEQERLPEWDVQLTLKVVSYDQIGTNG